MQVAVLRQPDRIRPFLQADRFFADYALGDLDPVHFPYTEWFGAEDYGELRAIGMLYNDLKPPIFFATGEAGGIEAILEQAVSLPQVSLSIREEHLSIVEKYYRATPVPMLKMALVPEDFRQVPTRVWKLRRLDVSHLPQLETLYAQGGGDAFRRRSLESGIFYGVLDDEGLVAVAGTHIVSDNEHIATLGNVMTHPDYRGQGLATAASRAVCEELLARGIELIGLSVGRSNEAALRVYEKIGFKRHVPFYEGTATRREN